MDHAVQLPTAMSPQADTQRSNQEEQARKEAESRENAINSMLSQVLDQQALVRLSNLSAVKPDKAKMVESAVINMARRGQLVGKLSDEGLKQLMERVSQQTTRTTTVKFHWIQYEECK
uniref:Double-stranded DNA-binding domain protein n=1 Tax=Angiostrongylus cantonensis TaxID=6313 RepID=A0A0K0CVF3_ANGCA